MKGLEEIRLDKKIIALIFRKNLKSPGTKFFTQEDNFFQIGMQLQPAGGISPSHIHKIANPLTVTEIQEFLYIIEGKVRVILLKQNGEKVAKKILRAGDSILIMNIGHGLEYLEESKILIVKQGPYPGTTHAKIYFNDSSK